MEGLFGQVVFSVGGAKYCWEDVVLAGQLWGDWDRVRRGALEAAACLRREEEEEESSLASEDIESAADEFRYARDLVAAEEMEEWLAGWGLTAEDWMNYIRSSLLRQKWSAELPDVVSKYSPSDDEKEGQILTEVVCSGSIERLAHTLAGRAAIHSRRVEEEPGEPRREEGVTAILQEFPAGLRNEGLPGIPLESSLTKMETLARLELSFRQCRQSVVTPEAIETQVHTHRTDWTRLDCQSISFPDEEMAHEAALCVREDGEGLDEVAGDASRPARRESVLLEEIDPDVRGHFLGARKGDLLGPVRSDGTFVLYLVVDKTVPSMDDPAIVARAEKALLEGLVEREVNDRVKWHLQL